MKRWIVCGLILTLSLAVSACVFNNGSAGKNLDGTAWYLETINNSTPLADRKITIEFSKDEVHGSSGCNTYFGTYITKGSEISFGLLAMTEMACMDPEGIMQQEQDYLTYLSEIGSYAIEGNQLVLRNVNQNQLTFEMDLGN